VIEAIYQQFGGRISVMIKEGAGHHPHSLRDPGPIADFISQHVEPAPRSRPPYLGGRTSRTSFYGRANIYRDFPNEGTYITCRGPWFSPSFDRYSFGLEGVEGSINVIVPKTIAAGSPWVFRADHVDRDATVDVALLEAGFHIVTGPVPYNADGPSLKSWNAVYDLLIRHGFSRKPVLAGAGGAAGEAYAWAIANPGKVSCLYGENPVLRCTMTKAQPLDNLAALARASVPILHVCGSLDPMLKSQTREAEKRYRDLGGSMTVLVQEGARHYPTAPYDPKPVVDFVVARQAPKATSFRASPKEGPQVGPPVTVDDLPSTARGDRPIAAAPAAVVGELRATAPGQCLAGRGAGTADGSDAGRIRMKWSVNRACGTGVFTLGMWHERQSCFGLTGQTPAFVPSAGGRVEGEGFAVAWQARHLAS
jgi:hypothetical protein